MVSLYANLLEKKKAFTYEKSSTPTGFSWNTNMVAVTSCEYALYDKTSPVPKWAGFVMNPENLLYCKPKHRTKRRIRLWSKEYATQCLKRKKKKKV